MQEASVAAWESARVRKVGAGVLALLVAVGAGFGVVGAATPGWATPQSTPTPSAGGWHNPFCPATLRADPWDTAAGAWSDRPQANAIVAIHTYEAARLLDADVVLVTASSAYRAKLRKVALTRKGGVGWSGPILITIPSTQAVRYVFLDTVALGGGAPYQCPTWVQVMQACHACTQPNRPRSPTATIAARFDQALPPLTCGKPYIQARALHALSPLTGFYGFRPRTAKVEVFIDSDGLLVKARVWKSSGIKGIDYAALGVAEAARYVPARFLCTPVVSNYLVVLDYTGR